MKRYSELARIAAVATATLVVASCSSVLPESANAALTGQYTFSADFQNVAGMYEGNEVDVLGVPVGKVTKITPKGSYVTVDFSVDNDVKLPEDVLAALISPGLVTNRHLELFPAYSGDGPTLEAGAHIPIDRTRTPVELEQVLNTLDRLSSDLQGDAEPNELGPLSGRIAYEVLNGQGDHLREIINDLGTSLRIGVNNKDAVGNIIVNLNELTQVVAENDSSVRELSRSLTELSDLLADQSPGLEATLDQVDEFLRNTSILLNENKDTLNAAQDNLTDVTGQMLDNTRRLIEVIDVLPLTLENLGNSVSVQDRSQRIHLNLDKEIVDSEIISKFCQAIAMRINGCRSGRLKDFGPDFGLTEAMLGVAEL